MISLSQSYSPLKTQHSTPSKILLLLPTFVLSPILLTTTDMLLFKTVASLKKHLSSIREKGQSIGFVPTMGALHRGHLSLVSAATEHTDVSVCCIFVNPTQFNQAADLDNYPRTTSPDIEKLVMGKCDILFLPSVKEIYPNAPVPLEIDFGHLAQPMEGAHRPGHFAGMAQVVKRLLDIVRPEKLFMGQKDYQQAAIVSNMISQLDLPVELHVCPIVREADGLAMSSRNLRLTKAQRRLAPLISRTLDFAKASLSSMSPKEIEKEAMKRLSVNGMEPEYFEIVDGETLEPVEDFSNKKLVVACTAANLGEIRLIDNKVLINKN